MKPTISKRVKWKMAAFTIAGSLLVGVTSKAANEMEAISAYINHSMQIHINGELFAPKDNDGRGMAPVIINGTSYLPAKAFGEALGATVLWNETTKTISITAAPAKGITSITENSIMDKVDEVRTKLQLGMTQPEVEALFDKNYILVNDHGDLENGSDSHWKYNFLVSDGYVRTDIPDHVIDIEGLEARKIGLSLFIGWKHDKVHLFTIAYTEGDHVYLYITNPEGMSSNKLISTRIPEYHKVEVAKLDYVTLYASKISGDLFSDIEIVTPELRKTFPWKTVSNKSYYPKIVIGDYNHDNQKELAVIAVEGTGTNVLASKIHIVRLNDLTELPVEDPIEVIKKSVTSAIVNEDGSIKVSAEVSGQKMELYYNESDIGSINSELGFGSIIQYEVDNQHISAIVPGAMSPSEYPIMARVTYGENLKAQEVVISQWKEHP